MSRRPNTKAIKSISVLPSQFKRWILRMLVPLEGHRLFLNEARLRGDELAFALGLGHWVDASDYQLRSALTELRQLHAEAEAQPGSEPASAALLGNIDRLTTLIGLSEVDGKILEFAVQLHAERLLDMAGDKLGELPAARLVHHLAIILDRPEESIRQALAPNGLLARTGLVTVDRRNVQTLRGKLDLISQGFAESMLEPASDPISLLRDRVCAAGPASLTLEAFQHEQTSLDILLPYLRHAITTGRTGVNIFIHGAPGTGKSQFARTLANTLASPIYEISSEDQDGDPIKGELRLRAYRAAQSFFAQGRALLVFDESEDVFNDGNPLFGMKSTAQLRKAWMNKALEESHVPTLWLSNSIEGLDPAFIRRFDFVMEMSLPPKSQRERLIQSVCADLLNEEHCSHLAESTALTPAVIARAASVVRAIQSELPAGKRAAAVQHLVSNTLSAQGHGSLRKPMNEGPVKAYDPAYLQADIDLSEVAQGLAESRSGRLCLYGPPGTGKSGFARWLADQLDRPLHLKRGSDVLSKWVGGTERNLAKAFEEAEREEAVLVLDEVDSFLHDRRSAQRSWEITTVNEMLTQMETFNGIFIATTNLMDGLDPAAMRRFDLKVRLGYLSPAQAWALLQAQAEQLGLSQPGAEQQTQLSRLTQLTPGDFAAVTRQSRFRPIRNTQQLIEALAAECAVKSEGQRRPIGFA